MVALLVAVVGLVNTKTGYSVNEQFGQVAYRDAPAVIALGQIKAVSLRMIGEAVSVVLLLSEQHHLPPELKAIIKEEIIEEKAEFEEAQKDFET